MKRLIGFCFAVLVLVVVLASIYIPPVEARSTTQASLVSQNDKAAKGMESECRIAALLPFAVDQLLAMGAVPVCAPSMPLHRPESWSGIPEVQVDHSAGPNLEQLIAADPDYIIVGSVYAQFMAQMESITGSKVVLMDVDSIDSVFDHIKTLGDISGQHQQAQENMMALKGRLKQPAVSNTEDPIDVLAIFGTPHSFYAFLPDSYLGDLVANAGGRMGPEGLVSHKVYKGLAPLSMEMVIEFDPDVLFVLFHGPESSSRMMFEGDPLWQRLNAVNQERMFFLSDDLYAMRPGSNLDVAIEQISSFINSVSQTRR